MTHEQLREFARSKRFGNVVNYAIVSFAIIVGLETLTKDPQTQELFHIFDFTYVAFFTFEMAVRILAEDRPWMYFRLFTRKTETENGSVHTRLEFAEHGFWNYFDFLLIALSVIGLLAHLFVNPAVMQIGRMFRIFRIIRLLDISEHLKEVERRIVSMIPTVLSFAGLLVILNYIYAIIGIYMFDGKVFATCNFSSVVDSFVTLFQVMTLDNWSGVMEDIRTNMPGYPPIIIQIYFVSFVWLTSIIAFNVFVAVMTSQVADRVAAGHSELKAAASKTPNDTNPGQSPANISEIITELRMLREEVRALKKSS